MSDPMTEEMDPEHFMPQARKACPGPPHDRPEAPSDYPCWECRLDAYFAVRLGDETEVGENNE